MTFVEMRPTLPDPAVEPVMPVEVAGKFISLGRSASYAAAARGDLPVIRIGGRVMVLTAKFRKQLGLDD